MGNTVEMAGGDIKSLKLVLKISPKKHLKKSLPSGCGNIIEKF